MLTGNKSASFSRWKGCGMRILARYFFAENFFYNFFLFEPIHEKKCTRYVEAYDVCKLASNDDACITPAERKRLHFKISFRKFVHNVIDDERRGRRRVGFKNLIPKRKKH